MLHTYPALITQDDGAGPDAGYGVVFPDLPGCVSGGDTVQAATEMAVEALALHIEGMQAEGLPLPSPSAPGEVPVWLAAVPGRIVTTMLVPVEVDGSDQSLGPALLCRVDAAATAAGETRAAFLARAVWERLERLHAT